MTTWTGDPPQSTTWTETAGTVGGVSFNNISNGAVIAPAFPTLAQTWTAAQTFNGGITAPFTQAGNGAVSRTIDAKLKDVVSVKDFGAAGDGVADDTVALQAWLNVLGPDTAGVLPPGVYNFSSALSINTNRFSIVGSGPYSTVLQYTGASTTVDLLTVGTGSGLVGQISGIFLSGFRIASTTTMTAGAAIHFQAVTRSQLMNIVADGQDGNGKLWNGFWFDQIDLMRVVGYEARAQNDGVRVNGSVGSGAKSDLNLLQGKINACGVGLHVGGAFGGLLVDQSDIINNGTNVQIDTALAGEKNRELTFGPLCAIDSATSGDGLNVNDALASGSSLAIYGWVASSASGAGINIVNWPGNVSVAARAIYNSSGDGIKVQDASAVVNVGTHTQIHNNGGWGINATVSTTNIYAAPQSAYSNTSGSFSANAHVAGTWTPTITFGGNAVGVTYTTQAGQYYTYGNIVVAFFNLILSSKGSSTGTALLNGLPIAVSNTVFGRGGAGGAIAFYQNFTGLTGTPLVEAAANTSNINLYQTGAASVAALTDAAFTNTTQIQATLIYVR